MGPSQATATRVLVTGSNGFVGRNLCAELARRDDVELFRYDVDSPAADLQAGLAAADVVFHLAGVNRPEDPADYERGNAGLTGELCTALGDLGRTPLFVLSSSIQAEHDNPYGRSKLAAEEILQHFCRQTRAPARIYRLKNLFGKWARPNYNSVTATFCHNVTHDLPIHISDPERRVDLTYVDDVIAAFETELDLEHEPGCSMAGPLPSHAITLGDLAETIRSFRAHRESLVLPDFSNAFLRALYATYLSYLGPGDFAYDLGIRTDNRGSLAEFLKSSSFGQIFVSRTKPGVTRGNHYHHTKTEKFLVVEGQAVVRFRHILEGDVIEYHVAGDQFRVVDIPPGYTHSIENIGAGDLVTLFWSSEIFDPARTDTYALPVL